MESNCLCQLHCRLIIRSKCFSLTRYCLRAPILWSGRGSDFCRLKMFLIDQVVLTSTSAGWVREKSVSEILSFESQWSSNWTKSSNKLSVFSSVLTRAGLSSLSKHALVTSCSIPSGFSRSPSGVCRKSPLSMQSAFACSTWSRTSSILIRSYDIAGCCGLSVVDWSSSVIYLSV